MVLQRLLETDKGCYAEGGLRGYAVQADATATHENSARASSRTPSMSMTGCGVAVFQHQVDPGAGMPQRCLRPPSLSFVQLSTISSRGNVTERLLQRCADPGRSTPPAPDLDGYKIPPPS